MSAAMPKASSKLACTFVERALISSTPKLEALIQISELLLCPREFQESEERRRRLLERCRPRIRVPPLNFAGNSLAGP